MPFDSSFVKRPIVIQKYGGSSVSSIEKLEAIAQRVVAKQAKGYGVVVVVSAMGNATDELLKLASQITPKPPARELDMLLSTGERTTMALLSIAIQKYGAESISFTGSQSGIITNDSHAQARIIAVRPYRIQDELERGKIVIVAGFQGTSYRSEITTLGRGGSDMTAVALAGALSAEACEIYSDVDGIYEADPKVVLDAQKLDAISMDEMLAMAQHGAKVLHDEAVSYAKRHDIALYAKKTLGADASGTIVRPDGWPNDCIEGIQDKAVALVTAKKAIYLSADGITDAEILARLAALDGAKIIGLRLGNKRFEALLDVWNCCNLEAAAAEIVAGAKPLTAICDLDVSNISLVGIDLGRRAAFIARAHKLLSEAQIVMRALFVEPNACSFVVATQDVQRASECLYVLLKTEPTCP